MYYLKKIKKCQYTGEKYHILYNLEDDADLDDISKIKCADDFFEKDDILKQKKIISFANIHKMNYLARYADEEEHQIDDFKVKKLMYYPSSVCVRADLRGKGFGNELYINIVSAIKQIHSGKTKKPLFLQHEQAEGWASTSVLSKKIYSYLESIGYLERYKKYYEDGWYKLNLYDIPNKYIQKLED